MKGRIKWTDREFNFGFPLALYPEIVERVRGTPARLEDRLRPLSAEVLTRRDGERWSIQENAGHLFDLESLTERRLDEYLAGTTELSAADMSNRKTYQASHNEASLDSILKSFRNERMRVVARLDSLEPDIFGRVARHPRLNMPIRLVDMILFQAEHDDFHLARISELVRVFAA